MKENILTHKSVVFASRIVKLHQHLIKSKKETVISKVNTLCNQGADIIDVGACSTAPNNQLVSEEEEIIRQYRNRIFGNT